MRKAASDTTTTSLAINSGAIKANLEYIQYSIKNNPLFLFATLDRYLVAWLIAPKLTKPYKRFILTKDGLNKSNNRFQKDKSLSNKTQGKNNIAK